jgi:hypothetical protein
MSALTSLVESEARNKKYPLAADALEELRKIKATITQQAVAIEHLEAALATARHDVWHEIVRYCNIEFSLESQTICDDAPDLSKIESMRTEACKFIARYSSSVIAGLEIERAKEQRGISLNREQNKLPDVSVYVIHKCDLDQLNAKITKQTDDIDRLQAALATALRDTDTLARLQGKMWTYVLHSCEDYSSDDIAELLEEVGIVEKKWCVDTPEDEWPDECRNEDDCFWELTDEGRRLCLHSGEIRNREKSQISSEGDKK